MGTDSIDAGAESRAVGAVVSPSPFNQDHGRGEGAEATVAVRAGQVTLTRQGNTVTMRPKRAVMGHGTLHLATAEPPRRLLLQFEEYAVAAPARQHYANLQPLYRRLDNAGVRDLLVALRDSGVPMSIAPRVKRGAGGHRATAWVSAYAFVFVELALFGLPASVLAGIAGGGYTTASALTSVGLAIGFAVFLLLAITTSPVPVLVRRMFAHGATRDPVRYFDTWAGRPPEKVRAAAGTRLAFVPGVPVLRTAVLVVACLGYAVLSPLGGLVGWTRPVETEQAGRADQTGELVAPLPSWLDGTAISLMGYAGATLLVGIFAVSMVRWRRQPDLYGVRWASLVGAFLCFAFGQAGPGLRMDNPLEAWLQVVVIVMIVAFACGRLAFGFAAFIAMTAFVLLAAFGVFADPAGLVMLVPVLVLIGAIVARYLPGGGRLVLLPADRAARTARIVWILWAVTVTLGIGLAVAAANLIQTAD